MPFDIATLCGIEFVAMAYLEAKRNEETDPVKRCYPGGAFDPMGMSKDPNNFAKMKAKEIANGTFYRRRVMCLPTMYLLSRWIMSSRYAHV